MHFIGRELSQSFRSQNFLSSPLYTRDLDLSFKPYYLGRVDNIWDRRTFLIRDHSLLLACGSSVLLSLSLFVFFYFYFLTKYY
jgi:hypothetical protein